MTDSIIIKGVTKKLVGRVTLLKGMNLQRLGQWEMAVMADPISASIVGVKSALSLTVIVHRESHFVLNMRVSPRDEKGSGATAFVEAVEKHQVLPETLLLRDEYIQRELAPIAQLFDIVLSRAQKLTTIPQVFRAITQALYDQEIVKFR